MMRNRAALATILAVAAVIAGLVDEAKGYMVQHEPYQHVNGAELNMSIINDDSGAIYDSASLDLESMFKPVADAVSQHNPDYLGWSENDIMNEWGVSIRDGEVYDGWGNVLRANNDLDIGHTSGGSYDTWLSTDTNSDQDQMDLTIGIPKEQLDTNGNGWSADDPADLKIALNQTLENQVQDAFVATSESGFTNWSGDAYSYDVTGGLTVPEPTSMLILGLATAGLIARRRYSL